MKLRILLPAALVLGVIAPVTARAAHDDDRDRVISRDRNDVEERTVRMDDLPDEARRTIDRERNSDRIREITRVEAGDRTFYRVILDGRDGDRVIRVSPTGVLQGDDQDIVGGHTTVRWEDLPAAARRTLSDRYSERNIQRITQVRGGNRTWYIVEMTNDRTVRVEADGTILDVDRPQYLGNVRARDPLDGRVLVRRRMDADRAPPRIRNSLIRAARGREIDEVNEVTVQIRRYSAVLVDKSGDRTRVWLDENGDVIDQEPIGRR